MNDEIYQHFGTDEHEFIAKVMDWKERVVVRYQLILTPFLNPREQYIVRTVVGHTDDFSIQSFGGFDGAERQRMLFIPPYMESELNDFEMALLEIRYSDKFALLSHGRILGTLLGQGIQRNRVGDIIHQQDAQGEWHWQLAVDQKQAGLLIQTLTRIGRDGVTLYAVPLDEALPVPDDWKHLSSTVSSFRLDAVIAEAFHVSRGRAKAMVDGGAVTINWAETTAPDRSVNEYDIISVRRYGRIRLDEKGRKTARGNYHMQYSVIKSQ